MSSFDRPVRWALATAVAMLCVPAAASAESKPGGTEGKVVFLSQIEKSPLWLWDPVTEEKTSIEAVTFNPDNTAFTPGPARTEIHGKGLPSTPVWSPDGTKFAYSKPISDDGNIVGLEHTAIWVYDLETGTKRRVSNPDNALWDTVPDKEPYIGHLVADWSPIWSADGTRIAFVRSIEALGPDDALYEQRGQNLWIAPANGGTATQVTRFTQAQIQGGVWIPGTEELVVSYFPGDAPPFLGRLDLSGAAPEYLAGGGLSEFISDYDVSPDGKLLEYNTMGAGGRRPFVQPLSEGGVGSPVDGRGFGGVSRFSGSGDGLLHQDCLPTDPSVCGLFDRLIEDPEADIRPGADRMALTFNEPLPGSGSLPARSAMDIQRQTLPVVFVPGFLGSQIVCDGSTLWPNAPLPDALGMRLAPDGLTNVGCGGAGPGDVVDTVLFKDIYDTVGEYVLDDLEADRGTMFGWDWRKRPQQSVELLDDAVESALATPGRWKDQDAGRVVLWGHSYGGLLIRTYLDRYPEKVARALTVGTPSWGSPKAMFPLAFGIETPEGGPGMDFIFKNSELRELAINLGGLYQLLPSARYTAGWLQVDGAPMDPGSFLAELGANVALFAQAQSYHDAIYDRFTDGRGRIDVKSVVGTGVPTFGALNFVKTADGKADVAVTFANGDGTVPGLSATQGPIGPLPAAPAAQIHVQDTCGVDHVPLANDAKVLAAYKDWIEVGRVPRLLPGPCDVAGGVAVFSPGVLGAPSARARRRTAAAAPVGLRAAEEDSLIDVVDLPGRALVVTDDHKPVTLSVPVSGETFTYAPLTAAGQGRTLEYGPLTGELELSTPAQPGGAPVVRLDGVPVAPHDPPPGTNTGGGATTGSGAGSGAATPSGGGSPVVKPPSNRIRLVGKPERRGRAVRMVVRVPGPGRLQLRATVKRERRTVAAGKASKTALKAGKVKLALRLTRAPRGLVSLAVSFKPTGGTVRTIAVRVR